MKRPTIKASVPLHLTWKIKKSLPTLRTQKTRHAFRKAAKNAQKFGLGILHFSILDDHIHLVAEAKNNKALALGMRSFGSSFAKRFRKLVGGRGSVFSGRFHLNPLENPTKVRNALAYVLQNFAKHAHLIPHCDRYSSAQFFGDWRRLLGRKRGPMLIGSGAPSLPDYLSEPRSWLAREGWKRAV